MRFLISILNYAATILFKTVIFIVKKIFFALYLFDFVINFQFSHKVRIHG